MPGPFKRRGWRSQPFAGEPVNIAFDKFTERARKVLSLAQEEAQRFNHNYIGTEHLLLGLAREGEGIAALALTSLGVTLESVRSAVEFIIGQGHHQALGEIGLTPRAKRVLELAVEEAQRLGHDYIGTEHLLLGLIREGEGIAAGVLVSLDVTLPRARAKVMELLAERGMPTGERPEPPSSNGPKNNVITCRLDDATLDALDVLVEAGVRSTRSDAASWLIGAGIEARRPLIARVTATVQEIRRLRDEARALASQALPAESAEPGAASAPEETPDADTSGDAPEPGADLQ